MIATLADHCYNVDHPEVVARREDVGLTGAVMQSIRDTAICMDGLPVDSTFGHAGGAVVQHAPFALGSLLDRRTTAGIRSGQATRHRAERL